MKRARALGKADLIPDDWTSAASTEDSAVLTIRDRAAAADARMRVFAARSPYVDPNDPEYKKKKKRPLGVGVVPKERVEELPENPEIEDLTPDEIKAIQIEKQRVKDLRLAPSARGKYTPGKNQPRDAQGRFRLVLARLKSDLGEAGLARVMKKVEEAENLDWAGDYTGAVEASHDLISTIDRLDSGALDAKAVTNVRATARDLGEVISQLPFNFDNQAQKFRYSDVPPALKALMDQMISRVEQKIGKKDADEATQRLRSFMSGVEMFNQSDISSEMSKLLRLLT